MTSVPSISFSSSLSEGESPYLDLSNSSLSEIPGYLQNYTHLECLNISNNPIDKIPDWLCELNLDSLIISPNQIDLLPSLLVDQLNESIQVVEIEEGAELNLSGQGLTTLSLDGIDRSIQKLDLSNNKLTSLPEEIHKLTALKTLILSNNIFREPPPVLLKLPQLQKLDIQDNPLTEILAVLNRLSNLRHLTISADIRVDLIGHFRPMQRTGEVRIYDHYNLEVDVYPFS